MNPGTGTIDTECEHCSGTGLYCGFAEPKGVAVVCMGCAGTGCLKLKFKMFLGRKPKKGVRTVRRSAGGFILTGVGPTGDSITYEQFESGMLPGEGSNVKNIAANRAASAKRASAKAAKRASR